MFHNPCVRICSHTNTLNLYCPASGLLDNNVEGRSMKLVDGDNVDGYDQPYSLKVPSVTDS